MAVDVTLYIVYFILVVIICILVRVSFVVPKDFRVHSLISDPCSCVLCVPCTNLLSINQFPYPNCNVVVISVGFYNKYALIHPVW